MGRIETKGYGEFRKLGTEKESKGTFMELLWAARGDYENVFGIFSVRNKLDERKMIDDGKNNRTFSKFLILRAKLSVFFFHNDLFV